MDKKVNLLNKVTVIVIFILLLGISGVSSTESFYKYDSTNNNSIFSINKIENKELWNTTVYYYTLDGFHAYGPGNISRFGKWDGEWFSGGTWTNDGRWLCCIAENGTLYDVNPKTLIPYFIGGGGVSLTGLAYNPVSEKLYGSGIDSLYEIDIETGEQLHIGRFGNISGTIIDIAFDIDGILYGWDVKFSGDSNLYKIDTDTGEASLVGGMGINLLYSQGGSFDYLTDILYLAAYYSYGMLIECDEDTGQCYIIDSWLEEWDAFTISYELNMKPPVTSISFDPPDPNGENDWYVSNVNLTFDATDYSGVIDTYYRINGGEWEIYESPFTISEDGEYKIDYYSYDYVGNFEEIKSSTLKIDQTKPDISLVYDITGGNPWKGWNFLLVAYAEDEMSGMDYVEFYVDDELMDTVYGPGEIYEYNFTLYPSYFYSFKVRGLILNLEITEEFVNFYSIISIVRLYKHQGQMPLMYAYAYDIAGNYGYDEILSPWSVTIDFPGIYLFQNLTLPNNFEGHVGRFYINAVFN
jgi:hypothetical protein